MQDLLKREEAAKGKEARQHLQFILATTDQLDDVLRALSFLKSVPGIDSHRIAVVGHSFGGQLTLLAAERDTTGRAAVTLAGAAGSWEHSPELRERLLIAVGNSAAPVLLVRAGNDFSTAPSQTLGDELEHLKKPHLAKIYPPVGQTPEDGHNFLYEAITIWKDDVFEFLDKYVKR